MLGCSPSDRDSSAENLQYSMCRPTTRHCKERRDAQEIVLSVPAFFRTVLGLWDRVAGCRLAGKAPISFTNDSTSVLRSVNSPSFKYSLKNPLMCSAIAARRTRSYKSTSYSVEPSGGSGTPLMDDGRRSGLQAPFASDCPHPQINLPPPFTLQCSTDRGPGCGLR